MQKISTFLIFSGAQYGKTKEAIEFYVSLFKNSSIQKIDYFSSGKIQHLEFVLAGQKYMAMDSSAKHNFEFTPAISIYVCCKDEQEIDFLHKNLVQGGKELMPLAKYDFSKKFCWLNDRYGISWQLNFEEQ